MTTFTKYIKEPRRYRDLPILVEAKIQTNVIVTLISQSVHDQRKHEIGTLTNSHVLLIQELDEESMLIAMHKSGENGK